jgi:hypothetical protein
MDTPPPFTPSADPLEAIREIRCALAIMTTLAAAGELDRDTALSASAAINAGLDEIKAGLPAPAAGTVSLPILKLEDVAPRARPPGHLTVIDGGAA